MKSNSKHSFSISLVCLVALLAVYFAPISFFWRLGLIMVFVFLFFQYGLRLESLSGKGVQETELNQGKQVKLAVSKDPRIGCILWLLCAATISGLGWWYPNWVMDRNSGPGIDDRSGIILVAMIPFYLLAVLIAIRASTRLAQVVMRESSGINQFFAVVGLSLASIAVSPVVVIILRLASSE